VRRGFYNSAEGIKREKVSSRGEEKQGIKENKFTKHKSLLKKVKPRKGKKREGKQNRAPY